MRLKPILFFGAMAALAAFLIHREVTSDSALIGAPAPDFELENAEGAMVRLSDYRGRVVFLNFWATWCEPCIDEMPDMMAVNRRFQGRPFHMLAVSVDTNWNAVRRFYEELNLDIPAALDPGRQASGRFNVYRFPETFLIDGNGYIVRKYIGQQPWTRADFIAEIERLIETEERGEPAAVSFEAR